MRSTAFFLAACLLGCGSGAASAPSPPSDASAAEVGCPTCVGAPMSTWALEDFQPKSSGFGKTYGLSAFKPKVTVVALLAGW